MNETIPDGYYRPTAGITDAQSAAVIALVTRRTPQDTDLILSMLLGEIQSRPNARGKSVPVERRSGTNAEIVAAYQNGMAIHDIRARFGVGKGTVYRIVSAAGVPLRSPKNNPKGRAA